MADRRQLVERVRELAQEQWSAKYMLLMATGFLTDNQLESIIQLELEVREGLPAERQEVLQEALAALKSTTE